MYSLFTAIPYAILMLGLAFMPLLAPRFWHVYERLILSIIGVSTLAIIYFCEGQNTSLYTIGHMLLSEYIPFLAIIFALYITTSGIHVELNIADSLKNNILILIFGAILSNFIGTTGASMLLIRPYLRLNHNRPYKMHLGVFFIILVSNIGGCLTPLGDPPLFLGYLAGVKFFWILFHSFWPLVISLIICLSFFAILDRTKNRFTVSQRLDTSITVDGKINLIFVAAIAITTLTAPSLPKTTLTSVLGNKLTLQQICRDGAYIMIGLLSWFLTPKDIHQRQHFNFSPIQEVARVFFVIFLTLIPITSMLKMAANGPFSQLFSFTNPNGIANAERYFWMTGLLSSFLDNAPTYLLFFQMAGGNAVSLMQEESVLLAISLGAVFMGAITYIGNAPNMMVRNIVKQSDFPMPSFLGYIIWATIILLPVLICIDIFFLR